jgi:hypothetical protein
MVLKKGGKLNLKKAHRYTNNINNLMLQPLKRTADNLVR